MLWYLWLICLLVAMLHAGSLRLRKLRRTRKER